MEVTELQKKILYVITKANWGGAQRYVFDLATAAAEAGCRVTVAYGEPGPLLEKLHAGGIATVELPSLNRDASMRDMRAYRQLRNIIDKVKPDILHLNSSKAGLLGTLAGRSAKAPCIIFTAHGWAFNEARPLWQKASIAILHYLTVLLAHKTIAVSNAVKRDARWMLFASKKITAVHNGVPPLKLKERSEARCVLPEQAEKQWVGIVAELHPTKCIGDAIDAISKIHAEHPQTILVVMGEGEMHNSLQAKVREKGLQDNVFLLGFVPEATTLLNAFDIFLLPSRSEGLSYSILEAGSAGLPVVASNVGGIPEIIEDGVTGLLVSPQNPHAIAEALKKLLSTPALRDQLGNALKQKVEREFSLEKMVKKTLAVYRA